jgi:4-hydroxy-3-polyprenylbenzoate decarboxylase
MAYDSMADFVARLEREGELRRISAPVQTTLEITALAEREMKSSGGGQALLIERPILPDGQVSAFPVLINSMGSKQRMNLALKDDIETVARQIAFLLKAKPPRSLGEAWELLRHGIDALHARPVRAQSGPCQEVIHHLAAGDSPGAFSLLKLPVLKCWPLDGGPFVTLPTVYTQDAETGERNIGMYRMQIFDRQTTGMHWQIHKVAARHGKRYYETGQRMPVAVCLGGDPVLTFAATAPMPDGFDEVLLAGFLRKKSVTLVKCQTSHLEVPANSDIVIEGYIDPTEPLREEGPFGDHTGFYTPVDRYPAFHVTCITHRKNAIYPATIVGKPPMEDFYIGSASVRIFLPIFKMNFPEIVDMALPAEGVFHNCVFVSIRKQYPYQAYKIMHGLWGMGQMMFTKFVVIVDADVDVHDTSDVLFHWFGNVDPQRDSLLTKGPCDSLDHAVSVANIGSHIGFDATRKLPGEGYTRGWPEKCTLPQELIRDLELRFPR